MVKRKQHRILFKEFMRSRNIYNIIKVPIEKFRVELPVGMFRQLEDLKTMGFHACGYTTLYKLLPHSCIALVEMDAHELDDWMNAERDLSDIPELAIEEVIEETEEDARIRLSIEQYGNTGILM